MKAPRQVPLPALSNMSQLNPHGILHDMIQGDQKRKKGESGSSNPIEKAYNIKSRKILDAHIARMFYSRGLPFHLARNPYYVSSYAYAANNLLSGNLPLGYNK